MTKMSQEEVARARFVYRAEWTQDKCGAVERKELADLLLAGQTEYSMERVAAWDQRYR